MKNRSALLPWVSLSLLFFAVLLTVFQLVQYSRIRANFAPGTVIAGVPVGGLSRIQAADRLTQAYNIPIEMHINDAIIQIKPASLGFELQLDIMLSAAEQQRLAQPFWVGFWDYLWNRRPQAAEVPLSATISEERLRSYLKNEIAPRYNQPPMPARPVPGTTVFERGQPGIEIDIERTVPILRDAMRSPSNRIVNLTYSQTQPPRPPIQNLQVLLQQTIDNAGFDGITEVYLLDLQSRQELSFAYRQGQNLPPGIAFTAASTIKIPIMVSSFRRIPEPTPANANELIKQMIEFSENDPADKLMQAYMDPTLGPLTVSDDMEILGLKNTFLAGYFAPGAPLLRRFTTPANQRTDAYTDPDFYNQTTPAEMGMLMDDIYQCAQNGGGSFAAAFPGQISEAECRTMIAHLTNNRIGVLIQAGLPEGTPLAHKHGWITELDGYIHTVSDVAIVYAPSGNYILVIYVWHPTQIYFDETNKLFAAMSQAVYNYFTVGR